MWIGGIQPSHLEVGDFDPWIPLAKATKNHVSWGAWKVWCRSYYVSTCLNMLKHEYIMHETWCRVDVDWKVLGLFVCWQVTRSFWQYHDHQTLYISYHCHRDSVWSFSLAPSKSHIKHWFLRVLNWTNTIKYGLPSTGHMVLHCQCNWWKIAQHISAHLSTPSDAGSHDKFLTEIRHPIWRKVGSPRLASTCSNCSNPWSSSVHMKKTLLIYYLPIVRSIFPSTVMHFAVKKMMLEEDQLCEFRLNNAFMWQSRYYAIPTLTILRLITNLRKLDSKWTEDIFQNGVE